MKFFSSSEKAEKKAYLASRLPSTWPSHLHNKCDVPACYYPNSPQAAEGTYNCLGSWRGTPCQGTYYVSLTTANTVMQKHKYHLKLQDDAKWRAQKVAEIEEIEEQKVVIAELNEKARSQAAEDLAAYYEDERRIKNASTGSTADDLKSSAYLERRAAQRRRPAETKPTDLVTEQPHHASFAFNQVHCLAFYPPTTSSRTHGSKSTTLPYEYNSPQYHHTGT